MNAISLPSLCKGSHRQKGKSEATEWKGHFEVSVAWARLTWTCDTDAKGEWVSGEGKMKHCGLGKGSPRAKGNLIRNLLTDHDD